MNLNANFSVSVPLSDEFCYSSRDCLVNAAGQLQSWHITALGILGMNKVFVSKEVNFLLPNHDSDSAAPTRKSVIAKLEVELELEQSLYSY